jgi:hypothetical protein
MGCYENSVPSHLEYCGHGNYLIEVDNVEVTTRSHPTSW